MKGDSISMIYAKNRDKVSMVILILPHLDDEFALAPLARFLGKKYKDNFKVIFCAERLTQDKQKQKMRRDECYKSLEILNISRKNIIFLNDLFIVKDLELLKSSKKIYNFLSELNEKFKIKKIYTLSLEGGHPDHDSLSLLIDKFSSSSGLKKYFIPAYNNRNTFFIPLSVFRPLNSQMHYYKSKKIKRFEWFLSLRIAFVYQSEFRAFFKLLPFILINLFSKRIYISNQVSLDYVTWKNSLTTTRYKTNKEEIIKSINFD